MEKIKVAVLVSGGGTNLQAILDAEKKGIIANAEVNLVISNKAGAYALERAKKVNVDTKTILKKDFVSAEEFEDAIIETLKERSIDLIVLAGFMSILSKKFTDTFKDRIINVHPSLIPSFCGDGFYGLRVHEKALEYGVKVTGATVHFVNEITDGGAIIAQKAVKILPDDTPEILQKRVMEEAEWILLPQAIEEVAKKLLMLK